MAHTHHGLRGKKRGAVRTPSGFRAGLRRLAGKEQKYRGLLDSLERRVAERTQELSTLLQVSRNVVSTLELEPLLYLILEQLQLVVDYTSASVMILEGNTLRIAAYHGPAPLADVMRMRFPLEYTAVHAEVIRQREPVILRDAKRDAENQDLMEWASPELLQTFAYIHGWMGVPLIIKDRVIGMLTLDHFQPDFFTEHQAELTMTFASQVALAIENARLYAETRRRMDEIQTLFAVQQAITSRLDSQRVLQMIADQARELTSAVGTMVLTVEGSELVIAMISGAQSAELLGMRMPLDRSLSGLAIRTRRPQRSDHAVSDPRLNPDVLRVAGSETVLSVPLIAASGPLGAILVVDKLKGTFTDEDERVLSMLASTAVIGLENARLYEQAEQAAIAAERSRLARELHDAVTQTLFSASLIAEVLPRLWERSPEVGRQRLEELRQLTRGALAEMRTLLVELRPAALADARLSDLLRQLTDAMVGRVRVPVTLVTEGECCFPPEVKVALYRIAQEALNNVARHAEAVHVEVRLDQTPEGAWLCISDDGQGFDPSQIPPNHLGVGIMRERAAAVGAVVAIESSPGEGTRVTATWKAGG